MHDECMIVPMMTPVMMMVVVVMMAMVVMMRMRATMVAMVMKNEWMDGARLSIGRLIG